MDAAGIAIPVQRDGQRRILSRSGILLVRMRADGRSISITIRATTTQHPPSHKKLKTA